MHENVLRAYDFERQNFEPTRVTLTTATCLDHILTSYPINTMTIRKTISDRSTVIGEKLVSSIAEQQKPKLLTRNFKKAKRGEVVEIPIIIRSEIITKLMNSNELNMENIAKLSCNVFIDLHRRNNVTQNVNRVNGNNMRVNNAIIKHHYREQYNRQKNFVTKLIKQAKHEANFQKLAENPIFKILYRILKCQKRTGEENSKVPDPVILNQFLIKVWKFLSAKVRPTERTFRRESSAKSMVVSETDDFEVGKIIKLMKNKKSSVHDGISNEILKCCTPIIEKYLAIAFNDCLRERKFPGTLKLAFLYTKR